MAEKIHKLTLYFRKSNYWHINDETTAIRVDTSPLGHYPLQLAARLDAGHFFNFDAAGLPLTSAKHGRGLMHNYTTLCAFALGHWELYLASGDARGLQELLRVADYILRTADRGEPGVLRLRAEQFGRGHVGALSAMFQGEAISVLCRAWQATGKGHYLEAAQACVEPFEGRVDQDGVLGRISELDLPWYEEFPRQPARHVLNGMIYALWGLHDLTLTANDPRAKALYETGVRSVVAAMPLFDNGFWSWYWVPERGPHYIASMMYHNLHICQLRALAAQTRSTGNDLTGSTLLGVSQELDRWAGRFTSYADHNTDRLRAALTLAGMKSFNVGRM